MGGGLGGRDLSGKKDPEGEAVEGGRGKRREGSPVGTGVMPPRVARHATLHSNNLAVALRCNTLHCQGEQSTKYRLPGRTSGCRL